MDDKLTGKNYSIEHGSIQLAEKDSFMSKGYEMLADRTLVLEGNLQAFQIISKDKRYS